MNALSSGARGSALIPLIARVLLAALFLVSGIRSLVAVAGTSGYFARLGVPMPGIVTWVVIAVEMVGAVMLVAGWRTRLAAWGLAAFVVVATYLGHQFWAVDSSQYVNQLNHFLKNVAIIGGLLLVAAHGPGRLAFDRR
jgi:putative oxidoreductase